MIERALYQRIAIYIFTDEGWTGLKCCISMLTGEDPAVQDGFEGVRHGYYKLDEQEEEGRIGRCPKGKTMRQRRPVRGSCSRGPSRYGSAVSPTTPAPMTAAKLLP